MKLSTAFGFDRHFSVMKYAVVPGKESKKTAGRGTLLSIFLND